jgi:excinuclease ABC subunit C
MLKDDKTYPWIIIKNENYPAHLLDTPHHSRWIKIPGPLCLGKHDAYHIGADKGDLSPAHLQPALTRENIEKGKFKVCLEYQLGNCKGPCQNYQTEADYDNSIEEIKDILNGKIGAVVRNLKGEMDARPSAT